jgi:serine/threonine protein kinase
MSNLISFDLLRMVEISNYEFFDSLGSGAFGSVYKVKDKRDCQMYALKFIELPARYFMVKTKLVIDLLENLRFYF